MLSIFYKAMRYGLIVSAAVVMMALADNVPAQNAGKATDLPQGQMRIIVPYTPGGGSDIIGRAIAQQLTDILHRSVIVENRPGANGTLGAAYVARAQPDGLTMLLVPAGYAANPALYKSLPYDQAKDLVPMSLLASGPLVLVVHPSLPVKSVKDLIALAKAKPGEINVGNAGVGSLPHLSGELFNSLAGVSHGDTVQGRGVHACGRAERTRAGVFHEYSAGASRHQGRPVARAWRHQPQGFAYRTRDSTHRQ